LPISGSENFSVQHVSFSRIDSSKRGNPTPIDDGTGLECAFYDLIDVEFAVVLLGVQYVP
jgi:hypothetical protein